MSLHTPRLCIDGRPIASSQGAVIQETLDQLVAAIGEEGSSSWLEQKRTVLLAHPKQVFSGQLKRFDTKRKSRSHFLYWAWERNFVENSNISAFHRFRPADRLRPHLNCATLTTVLPAHHALKYFRKIDKEEFFIVPSTGDKEILYKKCGIPLNQIITVTPTVRRFVHFSKNFRKSPEGWILILTDGSSPVDSKKLANVLAGRYATIPRKILNLQDENQFVPSRWIETLQNTRMVFYLGSASFDWPFPALESLFFGLPTVVSNENAALNSVWREKTLLLNHFLMDPPDWGTLEKKTASQRLFLFEKGCFDGIGMARQYQTIYSSLEGASFSSTPSCQD